MGLKKMKALLKRKKSHYPHTNSKGKSETLPEFKHYRVFNTTTNGTKIEEDEVPDITDPFFLIETISTVVAEEEDTLNLPKAPVSPQDKTSHDTLFKISMVESKKQPLQWLSKAARIKFFSGNQLFLNIVEKVVNSKLF
ncbi:hypothetical protein TSAR_001708 [Trichomalopsis sarcophagae]|uniref:Uncharacterized protein n=1 Tax=Trichomalopsis sarcophagae TaxID=543379 RepID=A0A232F705_9HYME|nr:hypothetical protein TSAR_001708 [Trichomalopsis sarcophagae]